MVFRNWQWVLAGGLAVLALLAGPVLAGVWERNAAALAALRGCVLPGEAVQAEVGAEPFFAAGVARCRGDAAGARSQAARALVRPGARVELLRWAFPEDQVLAQLAVAHQPADPAGYFWLGGLLAKEDAQGAAGMYAQGLLLEPEAANEWYQYGVLLERELGDWEAAVRAYDQACWYMDQGKNGCPNAGRLYYEHGKYEEALRAFERSLKQLPGWPPAVEGYQKSLEALQKMP